MPNTGCDRPDTGVTRHYVQLVTTHHAPLDLMHIGWVAHCGRGMA